MMKNFLYMLVVGGIMMISPHSYAHSSTSTNELVKSMLLRVAEFGSDTPDCEPQNERRLAPVTWKGFLVGGENEGWTLPEKKAAFLWFLSVASTNDWSASSSEDDEYVRVAIRQSQLLACSEAVPAMKAMVVNPNGIYKDRAVDLIARLGAFDGSMASFLENVFTNHVGVDSAVRFSAIKGVSKRLMNETCFNDDMVNTLHAIYRNRNRDCVGAITTDRLLSAKLDNYAISSNRMATACRMLSMQNARQGLVGYFTNVTNQLQSSGQPLRQLTIGEGENE